MFFLRSSRQSNIMGTSITQLFGAGLVKVSCLRQLKSVEDLSGGCQTSKNIYGTRDHECLRDRRSASELQKDRDEPKNSLLQSAPL